MWDKVKTFVEGSKVAQFVLVLLLGVAIGAIFYPTKRIEEREKSRYEEQLKITKEANEKEVKQLNERLDKSVEETKQVRQESETKISKLTTQVHDLQSKQKTSYYKLVKPDGTVEIKKYSESEVTESTKVITQIQEEFKTKIESIETKWETLHKERVETLQKEWSSKEQTYQTKIAELEKSKVTEINQKKFGLEAGLMSNLNYYGHFNADIFGPIFIGGQAEFGPAPAFGLGLGIRF